jgi:SAM-dependent methyltransferase
MNYLNLGCGNRYHPDWTNINFTSTNKDVIAHNLNNGIPFPDQSFDLIYHSHILEHFSKTDAEPFIKECYRVLRPQGTLRVVVPDLEEIARVYLKTLDKVSAGFEEEISNYEWILLEMYDQTVRNKPGGEMISFLSKQNLSNQDFIIKRCGIEIENIIRSAHNQTSFPNPTEEGSFKKILKHIYRLLRYPDYRHQAMLKLLLSSAELDALKIGQFRQSGEVHQWMYDRYSLKRLLEESGFVDIKQYAANESSIPNWTSFNLDTEPDGTVYKPDSLYIEATKPDL